MWERWGRKSYIHGSGVGVDEGESTTTDSSDSTSSCSLLFAIRLCSSWVVSSSHFYFLAKGRGHVKSCVATCMNYDKINEAKDWVSTLSNMLEITCHLFGCVTEDSWLSYPKLVVSPKDTPVSGFKNGGTEVERSPALRLDRLLFILPAGELCPNESLYFNGLSCPITMLP